MWIELQFLRSFARKTLHTYVSPLCALNALIKFGTADTAVWLQMVLPPRPDVFLLFVCNSRVELWSFCASSSMTKHVLSATIRCMCAPTYTRYSLIDIPFPRFLAGAVSDLCRRATAAGSRSGATWYRCSTERYTWYPVPRTPTDRPPVPGTDPDP